MISMAGVHDDREGGREAVGLRGHGVGRADRHRSLTRIAVHIGVAASRLRLLSGQERDGAVRRRGIIRLEIAGLKLERELTASSVERGTDATAAAAAMRRTALPKSTSEFSHLLAAHALPIPAHRIGPAAPASPLHRPYCRHPRGRVHHDNGGSPSATRRQSAHSERWDPHGASQERRYRWPRD